MTSAGLLEPPATAAQERYVPAGRARTLAGFVRADAAARRASAGVPARFDPVSLASLPEPARRWLMHSIEPGTPLWSTAELGSHGRIRLGVHWHDYTAAQILAPDVGFVWAARTHVGHLPVTGFDSLVRGDGLTHWRAVGFPVRSGSGADTTLSAADRLASDCVLLPTSLVDAFWHRGPDDDSAVFYRRVAGRSSRSRVTVHVDPDGRLREVDIPRWGRPDGPAFGQHVFRVRFAGEFHVDGLTIPDSYSASWPAADGVGEDVVTAVLDTVALA